MIWYISELETKIGLKPFFTKDHFGKREDGFWCVKPNATESIELECMPSNKGGKKFDDENRYIISGSVQNYMQSPILDPISESKTNVGPISSTAF